MNSRSEILLGMLALAGVIIIAFGTVVVVLWLIIHAVDLVHRLTDHNMRDAVREYRQVESDIRKDQP